jgi:hypothetical protein
VYPAGRRDTGEVVMFGLSKTKTLTGLQKSLFGACFRKNNYSPAAQEATTEATTNAGAWLLIDRRPRSNR